MTTTIANPLNALERNTLRNCERTIEKGLQTALEVGNALLEIRDSRLYRETHKTFRAYCDDRWQFTDRRARQLIEGAQIGLQMGTTGSGSSEGDAGTQSGHSTPGPTSERQTRELARLPQDQQAAAWTDAVEEAGGEQPTAAQVKEVVERYLADNEPYVEEEQEEEASKNSRRQSPKKRNIPVKALTGAERDAFYARAQVKVWYETIGRWLGQNPSIDDYRRKWPGPKGDRVVKAATELYEALKKWQQAIK